MVSPLVNLIATGRKMSSYSKATLGESIVPPYNPILKKHYWTVHVIYHVKDPEQAVMDDSYILDANSRAAIVGPGCVYCTKPYSLEVSVSPCTGVAVMRTVL